MAALDSAKVDTAESRRIDVRCGSMKLIFQIAAGILLAGAIAWELRDYMLRTEVEQFVRSLPNLPKPKQEVQQRPTENTPLRVLLPKTTVDGCANFVSTSDGTRHCLNGQTR
jgi:hypothetical protein